MRLASTDMHRHIRTRHQGINVLSVSIHGLNVGAVYLPPKMPDEEVAAVLHSLADHHIVIGDFNVPVNTTTGANTNTARAALLRTYLRTHKMYMCQPQHTCRDRVLDHIVASEGTVVSDYTVTE